MGTRNLTMVIKNDEMKVAQYGQWDGYPEGLGVQVLNFVKHLKEDDNKDKFMSQLDRVKFIDDEYSKKIDEFMESIGVTDGWMNMEQADKYKAKFPLLSRDVGGDILEAILYADGEDEMRVHDAQDFIADSLFCEWAYLIDMDNEVLEVYEGFNKKSLEEGQRFKGVETDGRNEYKPCACIIKFKFDELPETKEEFCKAIEEKSRYENS